jgi:hypothetical protein
MAALASRRRTRCPAPASIPASSSATTSARRSSHARRVRPRSRRSAGSSPRSRASSGGGGEPASLAPNGVPAGPPFPDPETDRAVYDQAGVFSKETIANAEATIDAIEARTGAEVVVYSQVGDYGITTDEADGHAQALMDQWGVGRRASTTGS